MATTNGIINIHTIGFTKTTAERFFTRLMGAQPTLGSVIDIRLNNKSQLAGFAKRDDLKYFLEAVADIKYVHEPLLAPTQDMLDSYKKRNGEWSVFERQFFDLMDQRKMDSELSPDFFDGGCLLCSEQTHHHCHRRLVTEFLKDRWSVPIDVVHL